MSDVRDWAKFVRGRWSWTSFGYEKRFPRGCQFSDVDAVTEFDGRTLFIEAKHYDGCGPLPPIETGQRLLLKNLADQPDVTVLLLFGCACCNDPHAVKNMGTGELHDWRAHTKPERRRELKLLIDKSMGVAQ